MARLILVSLPALFFCCALFGTAVSFEVWSDTQNEENPCLQLPSLCESGYECFNNAPGKYECFKSVTGTYDLADRQFASSSTHGVTTLGTRGTASGGYHPLLETVFFAPDRQSQPWLSIGPTGAYSLWTGVGAGELNEGTEASDQAYSGAVWAPKLKRLYFLPCYNAFKTHWHFVDESGQVQTYEHHAGSLPQGAYLDGQYTTDRDRIFLFPMAQTGGVWHYIDGVTGTVEAYTHTHSFVAYDFTGGAYSPKLGRIYLSGGFTSGGPTWAYIDTNKDAGSSGVDPWVHTYSVGSTGAGVFAYASGAVCPGLGRVYFAPSGAADQSQWHFINDEATPTVGTESVANPAVNNAYYTAHYIPKQDVIWFSCGAIQQAWHYVDCKTGTIRQFNHGFANSEFSTENAGQGIRTYNGAVYHEKLQRLYLSPYTNANQPKWHYISTDKWAASYPAHDISEL